MPRSLQTPRAIQEDHRLLRRFLLITEYGVPGDQKTEVAAKIRVQRRRVEAHSRNQMCRSGHFREAEADYGFEIFSLGSSDIVSIHAVSDIRFLDAFNDFVPVHHLRASGAIIPLDAVEKAERFIVSARDGGLDAQTHPIHAVVHVKLDTILSVVAADILRPRLQRLLRDRLEDRAVVLQGLDMVEVVILIRARTP